MSWLKRIEPVIIAQSSDVPFVIKEDGVLLCFDNYYYTEMDKSDHFIKLTASKSDLGQQSTNCLYFKTFPRLIPFEDIIVLDNVIAEGHIIKRASFQVEEPKKILLIKSAYLQDLKDEEFQELVETIDDFDESFLLTEEELSPQDRILESMMHTVYHSCWYKTCASILDQSLTNKNRKYCWTKSAPELSLTIHGMKNSEEYSEISSCLEDIDVSEKEIFWS